MQQKKEQPNIVGETQNQRAFWISVSTGILMLVVLVILLLTSSGRELTSIGDVRLLTAWIILASGISAWLSRKNKGQMGLGLLLTTYYIVVFWISLYISDLGAPIAAITITLTFGVASAVFPGTRMARYVNILAVVVSVAAILLDVFEPFKRTPNDTPVVTWVLTGLMMLVYGGMIIFRFGSYNLRAKLTIAFLAATIIPLTILAFINDRNSRQALTNGANQSLQAEATSTAVEIDTFISSNLDTVRSEAQLPATVEYLNMPAGARANSAEEDRALKLIIALSRKDPIYIESVAIVDANGTTLLDTFSADIGTNKSDRSWFQRPLETKLPYASDIEFSQTSSIAWIYFSAPVRNTAGDIIGVFRTRYNSAVLQEIISSKNNRLGQGSFAILLDAETHLRLAHGTTPSIIFKSVVPLDAATVSDLQARRLMPPGAPEELSTNLPEFEAALDNYKDQPFFLTELRIGDNTLEEGAIVEMKTQNWHVVYAQEEAVFLAPINQQARGNLVLAIIIAGLVAAFALVISATLSGPIIRLTQTAEAIAAGDINIQAKVESGDEIGILAATFNRMTQQLRDFIVSLEERVAARTKDLATVAEVGTATSTILEADKLLKAVVELTKERFNLYHSHIYLLDETGENLTLAAGAGEAGRIMVAEKRSIPLSREQSLVARAARERKGVTVNDVTLAPDFLPNPLLPDTRSELAVPMLVGDALVGVFDIQSEQVGRFTESDINIQTTLASQLASSIQNARLYERSKSQAEFETLVNAINQKIQRAASLEDTLQTAVREIGLALGASRVAVKISAKQGANEQN